MGNIGTVDGAKRYQAPYMRGGLCRTQQHQPRKRRVGCSSGFRGMWVMPTLTRSQRGTPSNSAETAGLGL